MQPTNRLTKQTNNYPIIVPLQIFCWTYWTFEIWRSAKRSKEELKRSNRSQQKINFNFGTFPHQYGKGLNWLIFFVLSLSYLWELYLNSKDMQCNAMVSLKTLQTLLLLVILLALLTTLILLIQTNRSAKTVIPFHTYNPSHIKRQTSNSATTLSHLNILTLLTIVALLTILFHLTFLRL